MNRDVCKHFVPTDLPCDECNSANVQKSTLREAAQQALEALLDDPNKLVQISEHHWESKQDLAVIAIRAALAEPQSTHSDDCYQWHHQCAIALVQRLRKEQNFCARCGKRTRDIHTCTPPSMEPNSKEDSRETANPLTDDQMNDAYRHIWRNLPEGFGHTASEWIEVAIRYAERVHGIIPTEITPDKCSACGTPLGIDTIHLCAGSR